MQIVFDPGDLGTATKLNDPRFGWLHELGAMPLDELHREADAFLFGYDRGLDDLAHLQNHFSRLRDTPSERQQLLSLSYALGIVSSLAAPIPTPRTWVLELDASFPHDLTYPLFLRTDRTSWKRGGKQARVDDPIELEDELGEIRRVFGWDCPVITREWLALETVGDWSFGPVPREVRVWCVHEKPRVWSFHYLHVCPDATGFPISATDRELLGRYAAKLAPHFTSPLAAFDFAQTIEGTWHFIEAAPGACAGISHERAFKTICAALRTESTPSWQETYAGTICQ